MRSNITSVHGNVNATFVDPGSSAGLTVGLTLFCLLLVVGAGALVFKFRSRARYMLQFGQRSVQTKADYSEAPQAESHHYTSRQQSASQSPIYENLAVPKSGHKRAVANSSRWETQILSDLILQEMVKLYLYPLKSPEQKQMPKHQACGLTCPTWLCNVEISAKIVSPTGTFVLCHVTSNESNMPAGDSQLDFLSQ